MALLFALGLGIAADANADSWIPLRQEFVGMQGDHLGSSVALRSVLDTGGRRITRIYVGAPDASAGSLAEAGVVQVYDPGPDGAVYVGNIWSSDPQAGAHFGASVAYSDGNLVIGAPDYDDVDGAGAGSGRIEFFSDSGTTPPDILSKGFKVSNGGNLGANVAIHGIMAASAQVNAAGGRGCLSTYRYDVATHMWSFFPAATTLRCGSSGAALGTSIAIRQTGDSSFVLVAGATGESQGSNALAGAAHVYVPSSTITTDGGLIETGTLAADSPAAFDFFGTSVGIDAHFVYVGATGRDNGVGRVGSVTIFKPAQIFGYDYLAEYFPSAPATVGGLCGASLSVDPFNAQFIVGCPNSTGTVAHEGTARVYRQYEFLGQPIWIDSVLSFEAGNLGHGADALGSSVVMSGDYAFVGAPNVDFPAPQTGNGGWKEFVYDEIFSDGFD